MDPNAISSNIGTVTAANKTAGTGLINNQATQSNDFLNRYKTAIGSQETVPGMYSRIGGELGLPTLQNNANMLNTTLSNIPNTYTAATKGYDVNSNQLSQIIGRKTYELTPAVTSANNAAANAQNQLSTQIGYEQQQQAKELQPYQSEQSMLADRQAREATMFSTDNQQELDGLVAKLQAGVTLTNAEQDRANQLAIAEKQYQGQLAQANATQNAATIGASNKVLQSGDTYYNPSTGQAYNPFTPVPSR